MKKHLVTNSLYIIPLSPQKSAASKKCSIHLICGAGTGTGLMRILLDEGYNLTAGVLNVLDTDYETAELLKIPVVTEAPFSPITEKTNKANLEIMSKASMIVLTSVPFGLGNIVNLETAKEALEKGIPTYVIDEVPMESRDFTRGKAKALMAEIKDTGAIFVKNQTELLALLRVPQEKLQLAEEDSAKIAEHLKTGFTRGSNLVDKLEKTSEK